MLTDKFIPHVTCFLRDGFAQIFLASRTHQKWKRAFDQILIAKHTANGVAGQIFRLSITGDTFGEVSLGIRVCAQFFLCLLYTSPSPRDLSTSRMPSSA